MASDITAPQTAAPATAKRPGVDKLLDAMKTLGMSTSGLDISYSEDYVGYPGGSYVNRMINITSGGKTQQFSADLTEKNALVTAYEMQRYLGVPSSVGGTNGVKYS